MNGINGDPVLPLRVRVGDPVLPLRVCVGDPVLPLKVCVGDTLLPLRVWVVFESFNPLYICLVSVNSAYLKNLLFLKSLIYL